MQLVGSKEAFELVLIDFVLDDGVQVDNEGVATIHVIRVDQLWERLRVGSIKGFDHAGEEGGTELETREELACLAIRATRGGHGQRSISAERQLGFASPFANIVEQRLHFGVVSIETDDFSGIRGTEPATIA